MPNCERCHDAPSAALLKGIAQFNQRQYFACHETLEAIWLVERDPVRTLYKGILQVGVGCLHLLRGNYRGAIIKLQSGADYLEPFRPVCMGVEVDQLITEARRLRAVIVALGPQRLADVDLRLLPQVVLATTTS
jgi:predicted metal-dependent hydrolase